MLKQDKIVSWINNYIDLLISGYKISLQNSNNNNLIILTSDQMKLVNPFGYDEQELINYLYPKRLYLYDSLEKYNIILLTWIVVNKDCILKDHVIEFVILRDKLITRIYPIYQFNDRGQDQMSLCNIL